MPELLRSVKELAAAFSQQTPTMTLAKQLQASLAQDRRNCPACGKPLCFWYEMKQNEMRCECATDGCEYQKAGIQGVGDSSNQAADNFAWKGVKK